jgi:type I restriction enzyme M protein
MERLEAEYANTPPVSPNYRPTVAEGCAELPKIKLKPPGRRPRPPWPRFEGQRDKAAAKIAERDEKIAETRRRAEDDRATWHRSARSLARCMATPTNCSSMPASLASDEIEENEFNLNIPRYVDTFEPEPRVKVKDAINALKATEDTLLDAESGLVKLLKVIGYEE